MAGFETPRYEPSKPLVPKHRPDAHPRIHRPDWPKGKPLTAPDQHDASHWIESGSEDAMADRFNMNWWENERRMKGHVNAPLKLTPAQESENMIRNSLNDMLHGYRPYNNNPFKPQEAEILPLPPKLQPPKDHPIRKMADSRVFNHRPGPPIRIPIQGR